MELACLLFMVKQRILLGQDKLALLGPSQSVDLTVVLNPDLVAAARQRVEADDLGKLVLEVFGIARISDEIVRQIVSLVVILVGFGVGQVSLVLWQN